MSGVTNLLVHQQSCYWKCKLNESVSNSKQKWNHDTVGMIVNNYMFGILMKSIICGILARVILNVITHAKLMNT